MRSQVIWTRPAPLDPAKLARLCARRALEAHKAGQAQTAAFWLDRAQAHADRAS